LASFFADVAAGGAFAALKKCMLLLRSFYRVALPLWSILGISLGEF
jgi:hypothetical protein